MNLHVDLGQVIITAGISIMGWLVIHTVNGFKDELKIHQDLLFKLVGDTQHIIGYLGIERRVRDRWIKKDE